jgi:SAM-dependent methyltransferase
MVETTNFLASKSSWPVESAAMASEELTFADDFFTHTVMNLGIHMVKSSISAAFEVYRTLKPGGTAIFTVWADKIFINAITSGHERTRPEGISPPTGVTKHWMELEQVSKVLQDAGFDQKNFRYETVATSIEVKNSRRWAEIIWSFMGALDSGWKEADEVKWNDAVGASQQVLEEWNRFKKKDDVAKLTMQAHVVIVTK